MHRCDLSQLPNFVLFLLFACGSFPSELKNVFLPVGCGKNKNIVAVPLKTFPKDFYQETTHGSRNRTEKLSNLYDIEELPESIFPTTFDLIDQHQRNGPYLI